jgi:hypothetical protein
MAVPAYTRSVFLCSEDELRTIEKIFMLNFPPRQDVDLFMTSFWHQFRSISIRLAPCASLGSSADPAPRALSCPPSIMLLWMLYLYGCGCSGTCFLQDSDKYMCVCRGATEVPSGAFLLALRGFVRYAGCLRCRRKGKSWCLFAFAQSSSDLLWSFFHTTRSWVDTA